MDVPVKNQSGETLDTLSLDDAVFNVPMNHSLVHQAIVIYQLNKRQGTHSTKTKAEVSGGGRKPWIQKHTGRARQGSIRSPQWRHGGVVFGPKPRSYRKALPRRMRRLALKCVLSDRAREDRLICVDSMDTMDGKTKSMINFLRNLEVAGSVLVVTRGSEQSVVRAASNLEKIWTLPVDLLSAQDVLRRQTLIMTVEAARWAEENLAAESSRGKGPVGTDAGLATDVDSLTAAPKESLEEAGPPHDDEEPGTEPEAEVVDGNEDEGEGKA